VFLVFFTVLYALLTYGLMFSAQQTLNLAAQDGARRMLRVQAPDSMAQRVSAGKALALQQASWVSRMQNEDVVVTVCGRVAASALDCVNPALRDGQVELSASYAYGESPLIPNLPLLGRLLVSGDMVLRARAVVELGNPPAVRP